MGYLIYFIIFFYSFDGMYELHIHIVIVKDEPLQYYYPESQNLLY